MLCVYCLYCYCCTVFIESEALFLHRHTDSFAKHFKIRLKIEGQQSRDRKWWWMKNIQTTKL